MSLPEDAKNELLRIAKCSIEHEFREQDRLPVRVENFSPELRKPGACFVTLRIHDQLRGCIGSLQAKLALVDDVTRNAHEAAFGDPRFARLTWPEFKQLKVFIAVLTRPEPIAFTSEDDLLCQLQPHLDGVILQDGRRQATLIPAAWNSIRSPAEFMKTLKMKAGLPQTYWSETIHFQRYQTETFS